jgi:hypothetical protein
MALNGWLLECCENPSLTVRVLDGDPLSGDLAGAIVGQVFRTFGTGVSGLCLEVQFAGPCTTGDTIFNQVYSVPYSINIHAITNTLQIPNEYTGYTITTICTGC